MNSLPVSIPNLSAAGAAAFFVLLLIFEFLHPLRRPKRSLKERLPVNVTLSVLSFVTGAFTVRPAALGLAFWMQAHSFGALPLLSLPSWLEMAVGILWMDLTFYYWHRLNHTRPLLWRFHNVHHVDPDLDLSTSFRFHFGEVFYSSAFRVVQVGLLGIAPLTYILYEFLFNCATMFEHSNIRLPLGLERWLNKVLVTPRMHAVHHSVLGNETNSNYSVVFSWWDRLNRSLRLNVRQDELVIGVPGYLLPEDNRLTGLLKLPFERQRPYWLWPNGKAPRRVYPPEHPRPGDLLE
jgi:sterol desaturase/sphingolipid hydroxylase (fatty acid hydroxylase superfamily)